MKKLRPDIVPPGKGTPALCALLDRLRCLQTLVETGLESPYGYDSVALRAKADTRSLNNLDQDFLYHSLWNPPKVRPSAHARMAGSRIDSNMSATWIATQNLLCDVASSLQSTLNHLGLQRRVMAHALCEGTHGDAAVQFGIRFCKPHDGSAYQSTTPVFASNGVDTGTGWLRFAQRVAALDGFEPAPTDAPRWTVVLDMGLPASFYPAQHYGPYQTHTPEQALLLCGVLDCPDIFRNARTTIEPVVVAYAGP